MPKGNGKASREYSLLSRRESLWLIVLAILGALFWALPIPSYGQSGPLLLGWLPWPVVHIYLFGALYTIVMWLIVKDSERIELDEVLTDTREFQS
jgi:hypothetical protein